MRLQLCDTCTVGTTEKNELRPREYSLEEVTGSWQTMVLGLSLMCI